MSRYEKRSVFPIAIALLGWIVLYIVICQEFLKSIKDGPSSTSAMDVNAGGHTTVVQTTKEPSKSPITPSSTKTNEAGMWSTEATTKTTMNGADYEIENSTATPLHIELVTPHWSSPGCRTRSTKEPSITPASTPPSMTSSRSNKSGIRPGNGSSPTTTNKSILDQALGFPRPMGFRFYIHPLEAFWRIFYIIDVNLGKIGRKERKKRMRT